MKLLEAILESNHRAIAGDAEAAVHPTDFAGELPLAALTCIDARLNGFFPGVLGLPKEQFIWLRNAGNIITGPLSSTMRSLALACAIKGGREIAIIGHTDCQVCKTSTLKLTDAFRALGVDRASLPQNLNEFFGLFASERQNVINAVEFVRHSPLIGPRIPVHGLMVDIGTGRLDWVVNGYQVLETMAAPAKAGLAGANEEGATAHHFMALKLEPMKFPESKIGEIDSGFNPRSTGEPPSASHPHPAPAATPAPMSATAPRAKLPMPIPPRMPVPPPIRSR